VLRHAYHGLVLPALTSLPPTAAGVPDSAEGEPGHRWGQGAHSLWEHMANDAQRKASSGSGSPLRMLQARLAPRDTSHRAAYTVLVVDDSESARYALARALRAEGFRTVEASAGAGALKLAESVSAVVLDVHLPDLHGLEVCRLLRARPRTTALPVVHVSSVFVEQRHRTAAQGMGADDYFVAPVDRAELAERLDELLSDRRARAADPIPA
jgi:CheY-like chemotaxis protein